MSDVGGTLEKLASEFARVFEPLEEQLKDGDPETLLASVGLRAPANFSAAGELASHVATLASASADLVGLVADLTSAIEDEDAGAATAAGISLIECIVELVKAIEGAASAVEALGATTAGLTPAQRAELEAFGKAFAERLLGRLLVEYLDDRFPLISLVLIATGGIEIREMPAGAAGTLSAPYTKKLLHFERVGRLFSDPEGLFRDIYGWGTPGFDGLELFHTLATVAKKFELPTELLAPPGGPTVLEAFGFSAEVNTALSPPGLDLDLRFPGEIELSQTAVAGDWEVEFSQLLKFATDLSLTLRPFFDLEFHVPTGSADVGVGADFRRSMEADPLVLFGKAGGSRLEVQSIGGGVSLAGHWTSGTGSVSLEPELRAHIRQGKFVISGDGGDSFIDQVLSGVTLESNFDLELTWTPSGGAVFEGSAALEIAIPAHVSLGPLEILTLYLRAGFTSEGAIPVELSGAFKVTLGPLQASVDRLGLLATFTFPKGGGNLGPAQADFAFKPPNGVGLAVDAGIIKGGGYLYIDPERGEYAGVLQLEFSGFVTLTAIGLISTKMPDGSDGFSLLVIITAEFGSGFQLGYGFTLIGVGGLLGLNRTMLLDPLVNGVRTGSVNNIMFPRDVVANAPRIISDLRAIFPPVPDRFLVGPMAKLGWGTPTLVSLSLGIILEIPGNIAILGVLRVALPTEDSPLIVIQVAFVGAIEFDKKRVWFFASLFESRVLFITLEGEMGVLAAFGDDAAFVLSVGGFHPRFVPPPMPFPTPKRIALVILNESWGRIRVQGYFAVTSNTVQFGAAVDLYFGFSAFSIEGELGFDALIQFSPFFFIIEVRASFALKVAGLDLLSVRVQMSLEGPTPWRVRGTGSVSLLFFEISADFDETWGDSANTTLPPIEVMPLLVGELDKRDSWLAELPAANTLLVSLRALPAEDDALVLHPLGRLRVSQRAVPLELDLDKVGTQKPSDAKRFELQVTGGGLVEASDAVEKFAVAQFRDLDNTAKVTAKSYDDYSSGKLLKAAGAELDSSHATRRRVRYEELVIDRFVPRPVQGLFAFLSALFTLFVRGSSVARCSLSLALEKQRQPFADHVSVASEGFVVAHQADNTRYAAFSSEAAAIDFVRHEVDAKPELAGTLHVIPAYEEEAA